jgi:hypothetical protein
MDNLLTAVEKVGVPLVLAVFFAWQLVKERNKTNEETARREQRLFELVNTLEQKYLEIAEKSTTALNNNTNVMQRFCERLDERPCQLEEKQKRG